MNNRGYPSEVTISPYRWVVCALLFFATTCNYMDRQVLGILAPQLQDELGWSEVDYGHVVSSFQLAYAVGLFFSGWFIDRVGSRVGLSIAVFFWSIISILHGFARTASQFAIARFGLGIAEAANFPASVKSVAEWFPERERPLAIGIFNSGANLGAIITPIVVPWIAINYGWQVAFYVLGSFGLIWVLLARFLFVPPRVPQVEVIGHHCDSTKVDPNLVASAKIPTSLRQILTWRITWGFAIAKFLTDPVWWFYLYWTPKYLGNSFGLNLSGLGVPLVIIYLAADVGSIGGGWLSGFLAKRGVRSDTARKSVMLVCAILPLSVVSLSDTRDLVWAIVILSLATAAHQGWSANLFASASTRAPKNAVASVIGVGGMAGAIGGIVLAELAGHVLEYSQSYVPLFILCAVAYIIAWSMFFGIVRENVDEVR